MEQSFDDLFSCFGSEPNAGASTSSDGGPQIAPISDRSSDMEAVGKKRETTDPEDEPGTSTDTKRPRLEDIGFEGVDIEELEHRIVIHSIDCVDCTHEVATPPGVMYIPLQPLKGTPSRSYPFTLDPFQKESICCIDNNQSVLVSAHTSAGKTVIAEYAIAVSLKNKQRVIYTTPIKALSNQKYREFMADFKDVGLITGDVTINPSASCLIMTTEILRNMLYRGAEIMREVGWVVFDEIHYMRDKERGVVWEETLILLPHNVRFVFLSATIPNARQFAEWVAHLHQQPCHVVYTDYRPTPLQHFIYPAGGKGIHMVVDETGCFKEDNFNAAMAVLQSSGDAAKGDQRGRGGGFANKNSQQTEIFKIIKMIMERDFAPVIVFSFSKKDCETYATQMNKLDFNTAEEKQLIDEVFNNAMDVLSEADRILPQVENLLPLLRRGIGIHHGGLLPILKETIEILFGEGLLKALFATETFAMGLNMPARTVLFTGLRKYDGSTYRWITSGEYIQMSGRAGRRGLDEKGIVILMLDEKVPPSIGRDMIKGLPDRINSAFHLTYNMILNLLRVDGINPEYMLERSFYQFQNQTDIPDLIRQYNEKLEEYNSYDIKDEKTLSAYYTIRQELDELAVIYRKFVMHSTYLVPFLQPGRLVRVKIDDVEYDWAAVLNFKKDTRMPLSRKPLPNPVDPETVPTGTPSAKLDIDVLLHLNTEGSSHTENRTPLPCSDEQKGEAEVVTVDSSHLMQISSVRLYCPLDLRSRDARRSMFKGVKEVKNRFPDGLPILNPLKDMNIRDEQFMNTYSKITSLENKMKAHPAHENANLKADYEMYVKKAKCAAELQVLRNKLAEAKSILHLDELKRRKRVLRRLGYCTDSDIIQLKGRVACELSSADELLITEMIFNGVFRNLSPAQACALLSCFVCDEKSSEVPKLTQELSAPLRQMQGIARRIAKVSSDAQLVLDEDEYVERFRPFLMDVVYAWCNGSSFFELCKMTDIFEGSIVRCMRRLEELLRQMVQASKTIGNGELEGKFNSAIKLIKRDIIFSSSLYL